MNETSEHRRGEAGGQRGHGHNHDHGHGHSHSHGHAHAPAAFDRAFKIGIFLNILIVVFQIAFGLYANSLALIADAAHNFSDVIALVLAFVAALLARWPPRGRYTYGFRKTTVLAALVNAGLLLLAMGGIIWEALGRLQSPAPVAGPVVIGVALVAIVINAMTAYLFMSGKDSDLNVRGAYLHMAADAVVSVGVVVAAAMMMVTGWQWIDSVAGLLIAAVILWGTWGLARDSMRLALDAVPDRIDHHGVEAYLRSLPGVEGVHDLHIWAMSTTETALTAHLVRPGARLDDAFLSEIEETLAHRFEIAHATIQIEEDGNGCSRSAAGAV